MCIEDEMAPRDFDIHKEHMDIIDDINREGFEIFGEDEMMESHDMRYIDEERGE